jgi:hypothetical protein
MFGLITFIHLLKKIMNNQEIKDAIIISILIFGALIADKLLNF